jgi:hypothetical protein
LPLPSAKSPYEGAANNTNKMRTNAMSKTHFGFETVDEQEKAK